MSLQKTCGHGAENKKQPALQVNHFQPTMAIVRWSGVWFRPVNWMYADSLHSKYMQMVPALTWGGGIEDVDEIDDDLTEMD